MKYSQTDTKTKQHRLAVEEFCSNALENDRLAAQQFGLNSLLDIPTYWNPEPTDPIIQQRYMTAIKAITLDRSIGEDWVLASYANAFKKAGMHVYDLDSDFAKSIAHEDWAMLLPELYEKWPHNSFYIKTDLIANYEGHIVCFDPEGPATPEDLKHDEAKILSINKNRTIALIKHISHTWENKPPAFANEKYDYHEHVYIVTKFDTDEPVYHKFDTLGIGRDLDSNRVTAGGWRHITNYEWTILNLLAYICAANADINTVYTPPKPVKGKRPNKAKERKRSQCTIHQVGYHIGAELREYERSMASAPTPTDDDGEKRSVRPHMRRAHWHHYWTGPRDVPEERELIIKWIAPTFVGKRDEFDGKPTVHRVR